jgi:hypothetical protein
MADREHFQEIERLYHLALDQERNVETVPTTAVTPEHFDATFDTNARRTTSHSRRHFRYSMMGAPSF